MTPTLPVQDLDRHLRLRGRPECDSRLDCDLAALTLPEFRAGLTAAVFMFALGGIALLLWRRRNGVEPVAVYGLLLLVGAAAAYWVTARLLPWVTVSVCVLAVGGFVADRSKLGLVGRLAAAGPGALLLAATPALQPLVPNWCLVLLGSATVVGAALASEMDRHHARLALAPVCLAVSVVAVYETVPDTDLVLVLLPLALVLALLAWPVPMTRFGSGGTYGVVGLLLVVVVVGGRGRLSAVVGGAACLGLLALEPVARRIAGASVLDRLPQRRFTPVLVGLVQLAIVFVATRVAGTRLTVAGAVVVCLLASGSALAVLVVASRLGRSHEAVPT